MALRIAKIINRSMGSGIKCHNSAVAKITH